MTPTSPSGTVGVIVVAAGSGARLGADVPKAFVLLAGRTLLSHAVCRAALLPGLAHLVVVAPASHLREARDELSLAALPAGLAVDVVAGGAERGDSVLAGVGALGAGVEVVLVHDAARALAPTTLFARVAAAVAAGHPAVVPGTAVVDTVKEVDGAGVVVATPDRSRLRAVQTPQGFERAVLERAHAAPGDHATDDAGLVERLGLRVLVVEGDALALKVTTPTDLALAATLLESVGG